MIRPKQNRKHERPTREKTKNRTQNTEHNRIRYHKPNNQSIRNDQTQKPTKRKINQKGEDDRGGRRRVELTVSNGELSGDDSESSNQSGIVWRERKMANPWKNSAKLKSGFWSESGEYREEKSEAQVGAEERRRKRCGSNNKDGKVEGLKRRENNT